MTKVPALKVLAIAGQALILLIACGPGGGGGTSGETLAPDQTLRFAMVNDVISLDPAHVQYATDITFMADVFTGLYKFDNKLKIVPDGATALPDVSADGKTYTFKLRRDMKFSNGDKITSADWVYSWTRTLRLNDAYASNLEVIKGAADVESGKAKTLTGLTAPDDYTLKAVLDEPAGFWMPQLAMPTASEVVSKKAIEAAGDDVWTNKPESYIGSGPFKMTQRIPKQVMEFEPVANWWGGSTGALKKIHVDIGVDDVSQVKKFESGGYDIIGPANQTPGPDDILRIKGDPAKSKLLTVYPGSRTTGVEFNFVKGPFASKPGTTPGESTVNPSDPGKDGRIAFSKAIDREQLADIVCAKKATCAAATGGYITKGFKGYLGDGTDPNSKFDKAGAQALYKKWDPDGSKVKNLEYRYNKTSKNDKIAQNLQSQWKDNLGVDIKLAPSDTPTLSRDRKAKNVLIGRASWGIDYDHPQDWFDNLYTCAQAKIGRGNDTAYCNPAMDKLVTTANAKQLDAALADYNAAQKMMVEDVVWANLIYDTQPYLTQTYVKGAGYNGLYDFSFTEIRLIKH
jgi:ABC-type oligopeptide transport system substrate-binding subunit